MSGSKSSDPAVAHPELERAALRAQAPPPAQEPVGMTVHGMAVPDAVRARRTSGRLQMLLVLLACLAPVVASYFTYYVVRPQGRSNYSTLIQPTRALPADLGLSTLDAREWPARQLRGQWLLVVVADAACPAECEARLYMQRQLREMLGRERDRLDKVWLVRGDGAVRPELRSTLEAGGVRLLRPRPQVLSRWLEAEPGRALHDHLYIIDPQGEWMMRTPFQADPARVKRDLERLLRASASWDQPGR